jgi:hypothetical protein
MSISLPTIGYRVALTAQRREFDPTVPFFDLLAFTLFSNFAWPA